MTTLNIVTMAQTSAPQPALTEAELKEMRRHNARSNNNLPGAKRKLSDAQVASVRQMARAGVTINKIATVAGVNHATIKRALLGLGSYRGI